MNPRTLKPIIAVALTAAGTAAVVGFRTAEVAAPRTAASGSDTSASATSSPASIGSTSTTPTSTAAPATSDQVYADGTWTGEATEEPWGTFQVEATIAGGQLVDVSLVASPQDRHSSRINQQAVPILTEEAIAAQSASIDMLSGATWTSVSYITSLQAALDDAQAARATGAG